MRYLPVTLSAFALALGLLPLAGQAQDYTLRFSHQLPPQHYLAQEYELWAEEIRSKSDGAIDVQIFPASQAFKPEQVYPAVAQGRIEAGMQMSYQWGNTIPEMTVMTVPYLLASEAAARKFVAGSEAGSILESRLQAKGVSNLAWLYMGNTTVFMSKNAMLAQPQDLKGLRIRGLDKVYDAGITAMGAEAIIMPGSEVYQALQTGIVDAAVGDLLGIGSRKYYEVQDFANVTPTNAVFSHIIVNPKWYDGLNAPARTAVDAASAALEQRLLDGFVTRAEAAWEEVKDKITLHQQTPAEIEVWRAAMQPASLDVFLAAAGENGPPVVAAFEALNQ